MSNVLCMFPIGSRYLLEGPPRAMKEFNFSAWQSDKHAFDWYVGSEDHRDILDAHNGGKLKVFGNLLANLKPSKPLRWQARCSECASIVEGYPENRECECGAQVIDMPLF